MSLSWRPGGKAFRLGVALWVGAATASVGAGGGIPLVAGQVAVTPAAGVTGTATAITVTVTATTATVSVTTATVSPAATSPATGVTASPVGSATALPTVVLGVTASPSVLPGATGTAAGAGSGTATPATAATATAVPPGTTAPSTPTPPATVTPATGTPAAAAAGRAANAPVTVLSTGGTVLRAGASVPAQAASVDDDVTQTVTGQVVDTTGNGVPSATIVAEARPNEAAASPGVGPGSTGSTLQRTVTDGDGRFTLTLAPGEWELTATTPDGRLGRAYVVLVAGEPPPDLTIGVTAAPAPSTPAGAGGVRPMARPSCPSAVYTITGTVRTAAGTPFSGPWVSASWPGGTPSCSGEVRSVQVGDGGTYQLTLGPGLWRLEANIFSGYTDSLATNVSRTLLITNSTIANFDLMGPPQPSTLVTFSGTLQMPDGTPAGPSTGYRICADGQDTLWRLGCGGIAPASDGSFTIRIPPGRYRLTVTSDGNGSERVHRLSDAEYVVPSTGLTGAIARLQSSAAVRPRVRRGTASGSAVAGQFVSISQQTGSGDGVGQWLRCCSSASFTTGSDGSTSSYSSGLPAGLYRVSVSSTTGTGTTPGALGVEQFVTIPVGATTVDVTVPDESNTPTISGTVRDPSTGAGVAGAGVAAELYHLTYGRLTANTMTDSSGAFTLRALGGVWSLSASASGYTSVSGRHVSVGANTVSGIALTLRAAPTSTQSLQPLAEAPTAAIRGVVRDATGTPVEGADVSVADPGQSNTTVRTYSAADGSYALPVVPGGSSTVWTVNVSTGVRALLALGSSRVRLTPSYGGASDGGAVYDFALPFKSSYSRTIAGSVAWPDNAPGGAAYNRSVSVSPSATPEAGVLQAQGFSTRTHLDGTFAVVVPAGAWNVTATGETRREFASAPTITVDTTGGGVSGLALKLQAPVATFSGTVTEQGSGNPVAGASVSVSSYSYVDDSGGTSCCSGGTSTLSQPDGSYRVYLFRTPASGATTTLSVSRGGAFGRSDTGVALSTGANTRNIALRQKTRTVTGRVVGAIIGQASATPVPQPGVSVRADYTGDTTAGVNWNASVTTDGAGVYGLGAWPAAQDQWQVRVTNVCNAPTSRTPTVSGDVANVEITLPATKAGDPGACTITTIAGTGNFGGDGGPATSALIANPQGLAVGADSSLYLADTLNRRVRNVSPSGTITTIAGTGVKGFSGDGGPASSAQLGDVRDVKVAPDGSLYLADGNNRVRKVTPDGTITTMAGAGCCYGGDGGPASDARFSNIAALALGADGSLYLADTDNHRIRKIAADGTVTTVAGNGTEGFSGDGGPATSAQLDHPVGVAVAADGTIYLADSDNHRIRKVAPNGTITTIAGTTSDCCGFSGDNGPAASARLSYPRRLFVATDGSLYIADQGNNRVRKIAPDGTISTVAGSGVYSFAGDGGPATSAAMASPAAVAMGPDGSLYIADLTNSRVRRVNPSGTITTYAGSGAFGGDGGAATSAHVGLAQGVAVAPDGSVYIADWNNHRVRKIDSSGLLSTVAGTGIRGYSGDGGPAASALLSWPAAVAWGPDGSLYIAEVEYGQRIRKVSPSGVISTIAGTGGYGYSGDGGPAVNARFRHPRGLAVAADGTIYIADTDNHVIRKIAPSGTITTVAGTGSAGFSGDGGQATNAQLARPRGIALAADGSVYVADTDNRRIRKLTFNSTGAATITTVAGTGDCCFSGDNGPATSARLDNPRGLVVAPDGTLFIAVQSSNRIRKVTTDGYITTVAGTGSYDFSGDGGVSTSARLAAPVGIALDSSGNLYVADQDNFRIRKVWGVVDPSRTSSGGGGSATSHTLNLRNGWNLGALRVVPSLSTPTSIPPTPVTSSALMVVGGTVTLGGSAAPAGTLVQAVCQGSTVAGQVLTGANPSQSAQTYQMTVFGDDGTTATAAYCRANSTIQFLVNGSAATAQVTTGTGKWAANSSAVANLSASSTLTPQALVSQSGGVIDILLGFDAAAGQARAYFTDPAKAVLNSLTQVETGAGYWIHTTGAGSVTVTGTIDTSVSRGLALGWNLVGWRGASRRELAQALGVLLSGGDVDVLLGFDADVGQARAYFTDPLKKILNSLTHLEHGGGYWVHTTKATTWSYQPSD